MIKKYLAGGGLDHRTLSFAAGIQVNRSTILLITLVGINVHDLNSSKYALEIMPIPATYFDDIPDQVGELLVHFNFVLVILDLFVHGILLVLQPRVLAPHHLRDNFEQRRTLPGRGDDYLDVVLQQAGAVGDLRVAEAEDLGIDIVLLVGRVVLQALF